MQTNLDRALAYIKHLEKMADCDQLSQYIATDIVQIEYPNPITPNGATRHLADILDGCERGKLVMQAQQYDIKNSIAAGETVVLEIAWTGTLAIDLGSRQAGSQMHADFAVILEFEDGKIVRQRNYDCFDLA